MISRKILLLVTVFQLSPAFGWLDGPTARVCREGEFESTAPVYISIKDEAGNEVWNSICSGTVVEDPSFVLAAKHCQFEEIKLLGIFSPLPQAVAEKYRAIRAQKWKAAKKEPKNVLRAEYYVDGIRAKFAITRSGRQSVLVLEKPSERKPVALALDHPMEKGSVCHLVGYSPEKEIKEIEKSEDLSRLDDFEYAKRVSPVFKNAVKRCGQSTFTGRRVSERSDISLFEGNLLGSDSVEGGDSGGACYVKGKDGAWQLAGIIEAKVRESVGADGNIRRLDDPDNNGIVLFAKDNAQKISNLLAEARGFRDQGPPQVDRNVIFSDDDRHYYLRRE